MEEMLHLQVAQDLLWHEVQLADDVLIRLDPPPMPNAEKRFRMSRLPQNPQHTFFSWPKRTRASNRFPQARQSNS